MSASYAEVTRINQALARGEWIGDSERSVRIDSTTRTAVGNIEVITPVGDRGELRVQIRSSEGSYTVHVSRLFGQDLVDALVAALGM